MEESTDKTILWDGYTLSHESIKNIIKTQINNLFENQVTIGYYLKRVNEESMFKEDGFNGIGEYAYQTYGIDKDRCSWLVKIAERFCKEGSPCLKEEWKPFSISKLREMVYLTDDQLKEVNPDTTVKAIREIKPKKEKVATSQLPERVQGEVITQPVYCIDGDGTCSSYEKRNNCDSDSSTCPEFTDLDGHKHPPAEENDQEIVNELKGAVTETVETVNDTLDYENNIESKKPSVGTIIYAVGGNGEITKLEVVSKISSFSPKYFKTKDKTGTIHNLAAESDHWHYSREEAKKDSWYSEDNKSTKPRTVIKEDENVIKDTENVIFEKECCNCNYNDMDPDEYHRMHLINFKEFPCNSCDNKFNHWEPNVDGLVLDCFNKEEGWHKEIISDSPEQEKAVDNEQEIVNDVDKSVIDTSESVIENHQTHCHECKFYRDGAGDKRCRHCYEDELKYEPLASDPVEPVEPEIVETLSTETTSPDEPIPSHLELAKELLKQKQERLSSFSRVQANTYADRKYIESRKVEVGALAAYICDLDETKPVKPVQPELPKLKNKEQREEWVENYKAWGEWYHDKNIDCHYYKYDFSNGDKLVVEEYLNRELHWSNERRDYHYYHLIQKNKAKYDKNKTYEKRYEHETSSMTEIVEYLKEFQKGKVD